MSAYQCPCGFRVEGTTAQMLEAVDAHNEECPIALAETLAHSTPKVDMLLVGVDPAHFTGLFGPEHLVEFGPVDPDCAASKHGACPGWTWDDTRDAPTDCQCPCHIPDDSPAWSNK